MAPQDLQAGEQWLADLKADLDNGKDVDIPCTLRYPTEAAVHQVPTRENSRPHIRHALVRIAKLFTGLLLGYISLQVVLALSSHSTPIHLSTIRDLPFNLSVARERLADTKKSLAVSIELADAADLATVRAAELVRTFGPLSSTMTIDLALSVKTLKRSPAPASIVDTSSRISSIQLLVNATNGALSSAQNSTAYLHHKIWEEHKQALEERDIVIKELSGPFKHVSPARGAALGEQDRQRGHWIRALEDAANVVEGCLSVFQKAREKCEVLDDRVGALADKVTSLGRKAEGLKHPGVTKKDALNVEWRFFEVVDAITTQHEGEAFRKVYGTM